MNNQNIYPIFDNEWFHNLRKLLHSEITIEQNNKQEKNEITIKVTNNAPADYNGSIIVFIGVGLRVTNGRRRERENFLKLQREYKLKVIEDTENEDLRQMYHKGVWVIGDTFPDETSNERSFGKVLFPNESIIYKMEVPTQALPYLDIRVEGQVSRRHLFHFLYPIKELKPLTQPLLVETFQNLDKIDIYQTLVKVMEVAPKFGPQTTLANLDEFKNLVHNATIHLRQSMDELNNVYHSAPNQELRDLMKKHIGQYITSAIKICESTEEALLGRDTYQMQSAIKFIESKINEWEEVEKKQKELKSRLEIDY